MKNDRLPRLAAEYESVVEQLNDPATSSDPRRLRDLSRRHKELSEVIDTWRQLQTAESDLATAREMVADSVSDERDLARAEVDKAETDIDRLEEALQQLLVPRDPNAGRNVIVEIRGAEGGEEANLFAKDLFDMYTRYAAIRGWKVEVMSSSPSERDGLNEVTFLVKGEDAWQRLEHEGGPHRVQRVPVTESQGRIHTSSAAVAVLPEAEEVDVAIDPSDLKVDVYRSTGPGGQSVNTTDSAVRITHIPTGIVVAMQDEKSQIQNRAKAMTVLRSRLLKAEQDRQAAEVSAQRRSQVGGGGRSEKIRTYNYKENRVTDHRIKLTLHKLDRVLMGDLDELTDALDGRQAGQTARRGMMPVVTELTSRQLVEAATSRLGSGAEARWIVEHTLAADGCPNSSLLSVSRLDEPVPPSASVLVESLVARRQAGEPLQYVLGVWPFRTLELAVDRRVLIPRPETEQVVEVALAELQRVMAERVTAGTANRVLLAVDLGTGSGAIALSLAVEGGSRHAGLEVWATDSSPGALDVARAQPEGPKASGPDADRALLDRVRLRQGQWFAALPIDLVGSIDLLVSNPPYVSVGEYPDLDPVVRDWEPKEALVAQPSSDGSEGLADVEAIIAGARRWLSGDGTLVIELAPHQADAATAMARQGGFVDARVEPDLAGRPRVLVATGR